MLTLKQALKEGKLKQFIKERLADSYKKWVASRPECVKKLIEKYPLETHWRFSIDDELFFLLGYTEDAKLILSRINSNINYEKAIEIKEYVCAEHLKNHRVITIQ